MKYHKTIYIQLNSSVDLSYPNKTNKLDEDC